MSCVVGVVSKGKVWMGADSAASDGEDMISLVNQKIFFNGPFLIGCVGSIRMTQLLQYKLQVPAFLGSDSNDDNFDLSRYMATVFVDSIQKVFHDNGFSLFRDDHTSEGVSLIGYHGHLFRMEGDLQMVERAEGYEAIGCGSPYALGTLFTKTDEPACQRVKRALEASHHFSAHVRPPYQILNEDEGEGQ